MFRRSSLLLLPIFGLVSSLVATPADAVGVHATTQGVDGTWSTLPSSINAPSQRREYAAIYDAQRNRYVIFGGQNYGGLLNEVWALSLGENPEWTQLQIPGGPGGRHSPQWGYDAARERLIVFGGYGYHYPGSWELEYLNDVWELSLSGTPHWTELFPSGVVPSGRLAGASIYDPLRQRFVGFGGTRGLPTDTYALDLSGNPAWHPITTETAPEDSGGVPAGSPPGSYGMTSIYDAQRDRMIVFGGSTSDDYYGVKNDVWELDLSPPMTWRKIHPHGTLPSARRTLASIYDPVRDRMVIYGGWDSGPGVDAFLTDTWELSLDTPPTWRQLDLGSPIPTRRDAHAAAFDPVADRMVVFGGWSGENFLKDTQFLEWGELAQAPTMSPSATATPDAASLAWGVSGVTGERAGVYRRQQGSPWSSLGTVEYGGLGAIDFVDSGVDAGERYGYMVVVPSQAGSVFGGEVWVDVPSTVSAGPAELALALHRVAPNPALGAFDLSFVLPSTAAGKIEVVDVAGRLHFSRDLASFPPGPHRVRVEEARAFAPGLYFIRLEHAGQSLVERAVVAGR